MIDEQKLAELRKDFYGAERPNTLPQVFEHGSFIEMADTLEKLWVVARAAERLIYRQVDIYAPNSKKGLLKAALDALNK